LNRSELNQNQLMLRSQSLKSKLKNVATRRHIPSLSLVCLFFALLPSAFAQADFTMQGAAFSPTAVNPGGTSSFNLTLGTLNGFNSTVALTCAVTPQQTSGTTPACEVSPATVSPPAGASVTVTTQPLDGKPVIPGLYTITVTGTSGSTTHTAQENITVLAVTPQFTVTVVTAVAPSSVHAGSGGTGTVQITPINGYSGSVTLSCSSITPLVTIPPVCSFNPSVVTVSGVVATATISINTVGPVAERTAPPARNFYAFWLSLPILGFAGMGAGSRRSRRAWILLCLLVAAGSFLLVPACGNNHVATTNISGLTPKNTYAFTVIGVDQDGNTSSNTGTSTASPSVTLTVD
jgi:hypothetical protein